MGEYLKGRGHGGHACLSSLDQSTQTKTYTLTNARLFFNNPID